MTTTVRQNSYTIDAGGVAATAAPETSSQRWSRYIPAVIRLSLGWTFLWPFLDKTFALGHETGVNPETGAVDYFGPAAWIHGGSPTKGFLSFATEGPFAGSYQSLAGNPVLDWIFMLGLLGIGLALLLGVGMRIAAGSGALLLIMMWSAALPPANNVFLDDHIVYALVLVLLVLIGADKTFGLGKQWERLPFVAKNGWLK